MTDVNDRLKLWLQLINAETEEELNAIDKAGVPEISKAVSTLREMSADEELQEMARLREKAILDERSALNFAKKEGREEVLAKLREKGFTEEQIQDILK